MRIAWMLLLSLAGCIEVVPLPDVEGDLAAGSTLIVTLRAGEPASIVAFEGRFAATDLVVREDAQVFRLFFERSLAALGVQPGPVEEPQQGDALAQPLPVGDAEYRLDERDGAYAWTRLFLRPSELNAVRFPGTDAEGCGRAGGCYLDESQQSGLLCDLGCEAALAFDVMPPELPRLSNVSECPSGWTRSSFSVNAELAVDACAGPEAAEVCGPDQRLDAALTCRLLAECSDEAWQASALAGSAPDDIVWVPRRPSGASGGSEAPSLAAAFLLSPSVVALGPGVHALPPDGSSPGRVVGRCPSQTFIDAVDAGFEDPLSLERVTVRGASMLARGEWSFRSARVLGTPSVERFDVEDSRVELESNGSWSDARIVRSQLEAGRDTPVVQVTGAAQLRAVYVGLDVTLAISGALEVQDSHLRGTLEIQTAGLAEIAGSELRLSTRPWRVDGALGLSETMVDYRRPDGSPSPRGSIEGAGTLTATSVVVDEFWIALRGGQRWRNGWLEASALDGPVDVTDAVFQSDAARRPSLRLAGSSTVARVWFQRPQVALAQASGVLRARDVTIEAAACAPVILGPAPQRTRAEADTRRRRQAPCVEISHPDSFIDAFPDRFPDASLDVVFERARVVDVSPLGFLKSTVQAVGGGRLSLKDVDVPQSPGRGLLVQGDWDLDVERVRVAQAGMLGACFYPGIRLEAFRAIGGRSPPPAPRARLSRVLIEDMDTGLMLLERQGDPIALEADGMIVRRADRGLVRASVADKTVGFPVDLTELLLRNVFVDVDILTSASPNESCD